MLNQGLSEAEVEDEDELQSRVPEFNISPDPGGEWNWLLGLLALIVASAALVVISRNAVSRRSFASPKVDDSEEEELWQDRLDDALIDLQL